MGGLKVRLCESKASVDVGGAGHGKQLLDDLRHKRKLAAKDGKVNAQAGLAPVLHQCKPACVVRT
jgi:hypothetical protein